jgi:uncharacterized RDD family membrane protein YckC
LIASVPVPFFRGADDWRNGALPTPAPEMPRAEVDLASRFADPSFDFASDDAWRTAPAPAPVTSAALAEEVLDADEIDFASPASAPLALSTDASSVVEQAQDEGPAERLTFEPAERSAEPAEPAEHMAAERAAAPDDQASTALEPIVHATLAPSWRRLCAGIVDALPLGGALMLMLLLFERDLEAGGAPLVPSSLPELALMFISLGSRGWVILAVVCVVSVVYHSFCLAYMRATVGDMLFGIRWLTLKGDPPRLGRAAIRAVLAIPSWLLAMAGVWYVLLSRTRRTLYDTLTGCYPVLRSS